MFIHAYIDDTHNEKPTVCVFLSRHAHVHSWHTIQSNWATKTRYTLKPNQMREEWKYHKAECRRCRWALRSSLPWMCRGLRFWAGYVGCKTLIISVLSGILVLVYRVPTRGSLVKIFGRSSSQCFQNTILDVNGILACGSPNFDCICWLPSVRLRPLGYRI